MDSATCAGIPELWDKKKTVSQNYSNLGIVRKINDSMRQTTTGKALLTDARVKLNQDYYDRRGTMEEEIEDARQEMEDGLKKDRFLNKVQDK